MNGSEVAELNALKERKEANKNNPRILPLSPDLANQIAAGEVVERPASVLKELLENSIDAQATQIDISVEQGGIGLIRVQDNGTGICKEDLVLSVRQHATSKIQSFEDLEKLYSYGFRGEALASISAVSRFKISSSVSQQKEGASLQWVDGRTEVLPSAPIPGTVVEVRDLFFNTPARRKFLRSPKTEGLVLEEVFRRIALSQTAIGFTFQSGLKVSKKLPSCRNESAIVRRMAELCGQKFIERATFIEAEANGLRLRGWLGSEKDLRAQPDLQYFYVNGRIIRDKVVNHALRSAYEEIISLGKYPAYVLFLELDPASVDVNVHPTKHEVRFREARSVHAFIAYSVRKIISESQFSLSNIEDAAKNHADLSKTISQEVEFESGLHEKQNLAHVHLEERENSEIRKNFRALAMIKGKILLAETEQGVMIIDVPSLQKGLFMQEFNELKKNCPQANLPSRPLLIPKIYELGNKITLLENPRFEFQKYGFDWTQSGATSILLRAVPNVIHNITLILENHILKLLEASSVEEVLDLIAMMASDSVELNLQNASLIIKEAILKLGVQARKHYRELNLMELTKLVQN